MQIRAIDFVSYTVSDRQTAVSFYRDTLGLRLTEEFAGDWGFWVELDVNGVTLALSGLPAQEGEERSGGGGAVALAVPDVKAAVEELRGKGVTIVAETQETPACSFAIIADQDGNQMWLHSRKDGTAG